MDHYKNPRNFGDLKKADGSAKKDNPLCGDSIKIAYTLDMKKRIKEIKFSGTGCSITRAGASILTEVVKGRTLKELEHYTDEEFIKDMEAPIAPARRKCALLGLVALREALGIKQKIINKTLINKGLTI